MVIWAVVTSSIYFTKWTFLRIGVVEIIVSVDPQKRRFRKGYLWSYDGSDHHRRLRHEIFVVSLFSTSGAVVVYASSQIWEWRFELVGGQNYLMNFWRTTTWNMFEYHFYNRNSTWTANWTQLYANQRPKITSEENHNGQMPVPAALTDGFMWNQGHLSKA